MHMLVLALAALCIFGSGAVRAAPPEIKAEHPEKSDGGHGDSGEQTQASYVDINSIVLPIVDGSGVSQVITISVSLQISSEEEAERVRAMTPKLKNAFLRDMYAVFSRFATVGGVIETDYIKARLGRISKKVMGDDSVHDVLLRSVHQRPV